MTLGTSTAERPEFLAISAAADEIKAELLAGRTPDLDALAQRYPEIAEQLPQLIQTRSLIVAARRHSRSESPTASRPSLTALNTNRLGDFQIVRELGRGGMGVVYEAQQLSLGRRVALKVFTALAASTPRQLERFQQEARIAAQLQHANIVPVYNVGGEAGTYYFAMQLVDGYSLSDVIHAQRLEAGIGATSPGVAGEDNNVASTVAIPDQEGFETPRPAWQGLADTVRQVRTTGTRGEHWTSPDYRFAASLAIDAAEALHYAHDVGVVHRDIKPGNLLLDEHGKIWVTDFGLAHAPTSEDLTTPGDVLGTLRYMSPEQAQGLSTTVDRRSDVYSLGATLYELLTLRPAFVTTDRAELLRQVIHEEPSPPQHWRPDLPAELETIVLKAMEKEPQERYETAGELAADLRRYLADEPILARRPSWVRRARHFVRRHRALTTAALVLVGCLAIFWGYCVVERARDQETRIVRHTSIGYEALGDRNWNRASVAFDEALALSPDLVDALCGRAQAAENLGDVDSAVRDLNVAVEASGQSADRLTIRGAFFRRQRQFDKAATDLEAAIRRDARFAPAYLERGSMHREQGRHADALADYARAVEFGRNEVEVIGAVALERGLLYLRRQDWRKADQEFTAAIDISAEHVGKAYLHRALARRALGRHVEALADCDAALKHVAPLSDVLAVRGWVHVDRDQLVDAMADADQALRLDAKNAVAYKVRADVFRERGEDDEIALADRDYTTAIALDPMFQEAFVNRGILRMSSLPDRALDDFRAALAINPNNDAAYLDIGAALQKAKKHREAIGQFDKALALNPQNWQALANRALAHQALNEYDKAVVDASRAIEIHADAANHADRGSLYYETKRVDEALADYKRAIELDATYSLAYIGRGAVFASQERYDDALTDFEKAIELAPHSPLGYVNRARLRSRRGDNVGATADYVAALRRGAARAELGQKLADLWGQLDSTTSLMIIDRELLTPERQVEHSPPN